MSMNFFTKIFNRREPGDIEGALQFLNLIKDSIVIPEDILFDIDYWNNICVLITGRRALFKGFPTLRSAKIESLHCLMTRILNSFALVTAEDVFPLYEPLQMVCRKVEVLYSETLYPDYVLFQEDWPTKDWVEALRICEGGFGKGRLSECPAFTLDTSNNPNYQRYYRIVEGKTEYDPVLMRMHVKRVNHAALGHNILSAKPYFDASKIYFDFFSESDALRKMAYVAHCCPYRDYPSDTDDLTDAQVYWRMLAHRNILVVINLCEAVEQSMGGRGDYWNGLADPTLEVRVCVHTTTHHHYNSASFFGQKNYVTERRLSVESMEEGGQHLSRLISQLHLRGWGDHDVPHPKAILLVLQKIEELKRACGPDGNVLAVHCHGGVGRTGTFILIHSLVCHYYQTRRVKNLRAAWAALRMQRDSVQGPAQLAYVSGFMHFFYSHMSSIDSNNVSLEMVLLDLLESDQLDTAFEGFLQQYYAPFLLTPQRAASRLLDYVLSHRNNTTNCQLPTTPPEACEHFFEGMDSLSATAFVEWMKTLNEPLKRFVLQLAESGVVTCTGLRAWTHNGQNGFHLLFSGDLDTLQDAMQFKQP
eukprot:CAMPEP_0177670896 /NCGR_PEP_ID=MMETSP0447-20121125/24362_1 /TAXON_ID=0 /ORGANISM="Stygamoeba regulata, Strain BSH-02190019" /LENGTH=587 /DNA_ID=CAMNT_0019178147 /DNA_START=397 /DNA_END=2160 /DNA_ORIENTATION=+